MKSPTPEARDITDEELHAWCLRMKEVLAGAAADFAILQALVTAYLVVRKALSAARISLVRLKALFGIRRTEKTKNVLGDASGEQRQAAGGACGTSNDDTSGASGGGKKKRKRPAKGHGRNGAGAYTGGLRIPVPLEGAFPGCACPKCKKGKLALQKPGVVPRIFGQPVLAAKIWEPERWRCSLCKELFHAQLPAEARGPTYDATAVAMIAILHFGNGFPFKRLEQHQASLGIPVPASDQSELLRDAYQGLLPVWQALIRYAAQCDVVHNDDTGMKILSLLALIQEKASATKGKARTGIFTTGIVAITGARRIALYFTGRKHAGENLAAVFEHRDPALPPPTHMSDGLDRNDPGNVPTDEGKCLTHGRRQFVDIVSCFPDECRRVVEDIAKVYRVDAIAKERNLSPGDRLLLHQEKSAPVMDGLRRWMTDQLLEGAVEPNSALGKAIIYMLRRWTPLTLFLRKAGAPLDNNAAERILKKAIRHRKNSLFYKTERGAATGDFYMSLIETCALNKVDAFHYLTSLIRNIHRVADSPESWMPWNYQAMLGEQASSTTAKRVAPEPVAAGGVGSQGPSPSRGGGGTLPVWPRQAPVALDEPERPGGTTSCRVPPGIEPAGHRPSDEARPSP